MPERKIFKNKLIKTVMIVAVILVVCTFLSRTIETLTLPLVEVTDATSSPLVTAISLKGTVNYEQKRTVSFDFPVKIIKVHIKDQQPVSPKDVLFDVDTGAFTLELEKKRLAVAEAENTVYDGRWSSKRIRDLLEQQLGVAEHELKLFEEQHPLDGKIRAEKAGVVSGLHVKEGELVPAGTTLTEICSVDAPMYAELLLPKQEAKSMSSGAQATVQYEIDGEKTSQNIEDVPQGVLGEEQDGYIFRMDMENAPLRDGQTVDITLKKTVPVEDLGGAVVVPKSAVEGSEGDFKMYILKQRDGIFGEEDYVQEIRVTKVNENAVSIAVISAALTVEARIIVHTDKALHSGGAVRVRQ